MSKGAAKENKLASLHDVLATVLIKQLGEVSVDTDEDTGEQTQFFTATPALLTACMKFLKDNDITCVPDETSSVQTLKDQLAERKQGHGKVITLNPRGDDKAFG